MKLIQKLMGRRQFLIAAGLTSTCALTCKKLTGALERNSQSGVAIAASKTAAEDARANAGKCPHLLSPLRIRNVDIGESCKSIALSACHGNTIIV